MESPQNICFSLLIDSEGKFSHNLEQIYQHVTPRCSFFCSQWLISSISFLKTNVFPLRLLLVWTCFIKDMRQRVRAVWWCKLWLLLHWHGLHQDCSAFEQSRKWSTKLERLTETLKATLATRKHKMTDLLESLTTCGRKKLKKKAHMHVQFDASRTIRHLCTAHHLQRQRNIQKYITFDICVRAGCSPSGTLWAYEFDLLNLRESHLAVLLLGWHLFC